MIWKKAKGAAFHKIAAFLENDIGAIASKIPFPRLLGNGIQFQFFLEAQIFSVAANAVDDLTMGHGIAGPPVGVLIILGPQAST